VCAVYKWSFFSLPLHNNAHTHTHLLPPSFSQDGQHYQASAADGEIGLFSVAAILERPPVPMLPMPWFHGAISRLDAEKLLDRNQDGQFLLRASQNTQGVYALAVRLDLIVWLARIGCVMSWLCTHTSWEQIYVPLTVEWIGSPPSYWAMSLMVHSTHDSIIK